MAASVKYANRAYTVECAVTMAAYIALLLARPWLLAHTGGAGAAVAIKLLPMLPVWAFAFVLYRHYGRIDEYQRLKFLENIAIAGGLVVLLALSWDFLEDIGAPHLGLFWAWPAFAVLWALTTLLNEPHGC